jgi:hypothetical protein
MKSCPRWWAGGRIARLVFAHYAARNSLSLFLGVYNDYFTPVHGRLQQELKRAAGLECPLTLTVLH